MSFSYVPCFLFSLKITWFGSLPVLGPPSLLCLIPDASELDLLPPGVPVSSTSLSLSMTQLDDTQHDSECYSKTTFTSNGNQNGQTCKPEKRTFWANYKNAKCLKYSEKEARNMQEVFKVIRMSRGDKSQSFTPPPSPSVFSTPPPLMALSICSASPLFEATEPAFSSQPHQWGWKTRLQPLSLWMNTVRHKLSRSLPPVAPARIYNLICHDRDAFWSSCVQCVMSEWPAVGLIYCTAPRVATLCVI